ncbi:MAG: DUF4293 domain-containing protein, partial [Prevotellaceae bacterium]|nr:DUF4293 domain-containing protein [Prevotellaceae bacterium]
LLLTLQIVIVFYLIDISNGIDVGRFLPDISTVNYSVSDISPAISLILTILAIRFIIKDEMKIRAYNRIR